MAYDMGNMRGLHKNSKAAYGQLNVAECERVVLIALYELGISSSCREIAVRLCKAPSDLTGRLVTLEKAGLIYLAGDQKSLVTGRLVTQYGMTTTGIEYVERMKSERESSNSLVGQRLKDVKAMASVVSSENSRLSSQGASLST